MRVQVKLFGILREELGFSQKTLELMGEISVLDALVCLKDSKITLKERLVQNGIVRPYFKILVNGRGIEHLQDLETTLSDGDVLAIFPPTGGG